MPLAPYDRQFFINCPFDDQYKELFEAIVFTVAECGFVPRCALEVDDGSQIRIDKIFGIISDCKFGVHDISRTELDNANQLPRFNMPLELGMFLGAKRYGSGEQREKVCLIVDRERYRYQKFISDLAGYDIRDHADDPIQAVTIVRNWLRNVSPGHPMPGGEIIGDRYRAFRRDFLEICWDADLSPDRLTFVDYLWLVSYWLTLNPIPDAPSLKREREGAHLQSSSPSPGAT
jgi:hypothetical protein